MLGPTCAHLHAHLVCRHVSMAGVLTSGCASLAGPGAQSVSGHGPVPLRQGGQLPEQRLQARAPPMLRSQSLQLCNRICVIRCIAQGSAVLPSCSRGMLHLCQTSNKQEQAELRLVSLRPAPQIHANVCMAAEVVMQLENLSRLLCPPRSTATCAWRRWWSQSSWTGACMASTCCRSTPGGPPTCRCLTPPGWSHSTTNPARCSKIENYLKFSQSGVNITCVGFLSRARCTLQYGVGLCMGHTVATRLHSSSCEAQQLQTCNLGLCTASVTGTKAGSR